MSDKVKLQALYQRLYKAYGPQGWWPAQSRFEVIVGAVLTQNTNWNNVEKALLNLKQAGMLQLETIHELDSAYLAEQLRPSGYFNLKAQRLQNLCRWMMEQGGIEGLENKKTDELRCGLLSVNGVGPETADDILLYAFERPVFVIDAYTRRLLKRLGMIEGGESYDSLRALFERSLEADVAIFNEYHALIVRHAKEKCSGQGACPHCQVEAPLDS